MYPHSDRNAAAILGGARFADHDLLCEQAKPKTAGEITKPEGEQALDYLHQRLDVLGSRLAGLEGRLRMVLRAQPTNTDGCAGSNAVPQPIRAPIINAIEAASERLNGSIAYIDRLVDSIGV